MDPILEAAEKKRDEIRQELRKIEDFLATYRSLQLSIRLDSQNTTGTQPSSTEIVSGEEGLGSDAVREEGEADATPPKRVRVRDNPKPADVVAAAVEVIREMGRPMTRREIHVALAAHGVVVKGADPIKALGTMLWRSGGDQLEQIEGRGYWLKGVPDPTPGQSWTLTSPQFA